MPDQVETPEGELLAWDLEEVLDDLMDGARLWDAGVKHEAQWEWTFRYPHWGEHALRAMRVLHSRLER